MGIVFSDLADRILVIPRFTRGDAPVRLHALQVERIERLGAHAPEPRRERVREPRRRKQRASQDNRSFLIVARDGHGADIGSACAAPAQARGPRQASQRRKSSAQYRG